MAKVGGGATGYSAGDEISILIKTHHHPITSEPHQTPLHLLYIPSEFLCSGCDALSYGPRYRCEACDFDLYDICATCPASTTTALHPNHPLCSQLSLNVQLPLHPHHLLKLQPAPPAPCALCFKACTLWRYRCDSCRLDLHLECALGAGPDDVLRCRRPKKERRGGREGRMRRSGSAAKKWLAAAAAHGRWQPELLWERRAARRPELLWERKGKMG